MMISDIAVGIFLAYYTRAIKELDYWNVISPPLSQLPTPDLILIDDEEVTVEVKASLGRDMEEKMDEALEHLLLTGRSGTLLAFVVSLEDLVASYAKLFRSGNSLRSWSIKDNFLSWTPRTKGWRGDKFFLHQERPELSLLVESRGRKGHIRLRGSFPNGESHKFFFNLIEGFGALCQPKAHKRWDLITCRSDRVCGFSFPGSMELNVDLGYIGRKALRDSLKGSLTEVLTSLQTLFKL